MDPLNNYGSYDMTFTEHDSAEIDQLLREMESGDATITTTTTPLTTTTTTPATKPINTNVLSPNMNFDIPTNDFEPTMMDNDTTTYFQDLKFYQPPPMAPLDHSPESLTLSSFSESPVFSDMDFDMGFDDGTAGLFPYAGPLITGMESTMVPWETPCRINGAVGLTEPYFSSFLGVNSSLIGGDMADAIFTCSQAEEGAQLLEENVVMPPPPPAMNLHNYETAGNASSQSYNRAYPHITPDPSSSILRPSKVKSPAGTSMSTSTPTSTTPSSISLSRSATSTPSSSTSSSKYTCSHCGAPFPDITKLKVHTNKHTKPFRCTVPGCDGAFAEKKSLQRHLLAKAKWDDDHRLALESHGVKEIRHACPHAERGCTYTTIREDNLKRHISTCSL